MPPPGIAPWNEIKSANPFPRKELQLDLVQSLNLGPIWQASDSLSPRAPGSARRPFLKFAPEPLLVAIVATTVIAFVIKLVIGLRATPEVETAGLDISEHGEEAYISL